MNRNTIIKKILVSFIVCFIVIIGMTACAKDTKISSNTESTKKTLTTIVETTQSEYELVNENKETKLNDISFCVPKSWEYKIEDNYVYMNGPNGAIVSVISSDSKMEEKIAEESKISEETGFMSPGWTDVEINGVPAKSTIYASTTSSIMRFIYIIDYNDKSYEFQCMTIDSKSSKDSGDFISEILKSALSRKVCKNF